VKPVQLTSGLKTRRTRSAYGGAIAEVPAGIWFLVVGFLLPLLFIAAWGLRIGLVYWSTRDACYQAAKSPTWDDVGGVNGAQTNAKNQWATDQAAWNASAWPVPKFDLAIMAQPIAGGAPSGPFYSALPSVNTSTFIYFIRLNTQTSIPPLISGWTWQGGLNIPGFTSPVTVAMTYQVFVENPSGLTK
jgi:hypothetical protein